MSISDDIKNRLSSALIDGDADLPKRPPRSAEDRCGSGRTHQRRHDPA
jgi:hypothetical protein